jgi:adenylate cyclase
VSDLPTPLERKLTAILYADVAGYSRLTEQDEAGTHRLLSENLDRFTKCIERHGGRVEHYAGDAILAEFPSVTLAVTCALTAQSELAEIQSHIPEDRRVLFRIGINLGEVIVDRGEIYGEGVNIAARLEALAEPGGVWISDSVSIRSRTSLSPYGRFGSCCVRGRSCHR